MKNNQTLYIAVNKQSNEADVFSTKKAAANFLNISTATIRRGLSTNNYINNNKYSIYITNNVKRAKKGFALRY
jgi:hypothetical protein